MKKLKSVVRIDKKKWGEKTTIKQRTFLTVETDCMTDSKTTFPHFLFWNGSVALCHQAIFWFTKMYSLAFLIPCLLSSLSHHFCSHSTTASLNWSQEDKNILQCRKSLETWGKVFKTNHMYIIHTDYSIHYPSGV